MAASLSDAAARQLTRCGGALLSDLGRVTSYFRVQLGRRTWKALHYTAYASAALFFTHGIFTDPELKGRPTDFLDGEKLAVEGCLLVVLLAVGWRVRYALNHRIQA